ncbi:MAG: hypothetical protein ACYC2U_07220 [Candidatus Amoebophilus sp.]
MYTTTVLFCQPLTSFPFSRPDGELEDERYLDEHETGLSNREESNMEADDESKEEWGDSGCDWEGASDWSDDLDDEDIESEQHSSDLIDDEEDDDEELGDVDDGDNGEP